VVTWPVFFKLPRSPRKLIGVIDIFHRRELGAAGAVALLSRNAQVQFFGNLPGTVALSDQAKHFQKERKARPERSERKATESSNKIVDSSSLAPLALFLLSGQRLF
jgi:hypothetical protein